MQLEIFELERQQSLWENTVRFNLTESGVHPLTLNELFGEEEKTDLLNLRLGYGQTNGSVELRKVISSLYTNQSENNVLVTNGSSEANFVAMYTLLEPGDEILYMVPNYLQIQGLAKSIGVKVKTFSLKEELSWQPDIQEIESMITNNTKMIVICNPDNPTGAVLNEESIEGLINLARSVDAYIYADEVYRGAELDGEETVSFLDKYDNAIVSGGLSKAYALPGLRIGWIAGPEDIINNCWAHRDYTSISSGLLSQYIASYVLDPQQRPIILNRNRSMLRENLRLLSKWIDQRENIFEFIPPKAGGMAFLKYHLDLNSTELTNRLRKEKSVFIVAGDQFGMDHYLRLGIGANPKYLKQGLKLFGEFISEII